MIVSCPNCKKQFKIDNSLIPEDGRELQCGSCNHVWFYKIEDKNNEIFQSKEEIVSKDVEIKVEKKDEEIVEKKPLQEKIKTELKNKKEEKISENQKNLITKKSNISVNIFFSYLVVFIISFVALIILLDTLKTPLINIFPGLKIILFNLFETLKDIKLFIIDLS
tara:strand:+ start:103 stop:597 length:495 start_codon:yes stop_codon:yes gene_type:complete